MMAVRATHQCGPVDRATGRKMQIDTCGSDFDMVIAVYVGSGLETLRSVASDDDSCGRQSRTRFSAGPEPRIGSRSPAIRRELGWIKVKIARSSRRASS